MQTAPHPVKGLFDSKGVTHNQQVEDGWLKLEVHSVCGHRSAIPPASCSPAIRCVAFSTHLFANQVASPGHQSFPKYQCPLAQPPTGTLSPCMSRLLGSPDGCPCRILSPSNPPTLYLQGQMPHLSHICQGSEICPKGTRSLPKHAPGVSSAGTCGPHLQC